MQLFQVTHKCNRKGQSVQKIAGKIQSLGAVDTFDGGLSSRRETKCKREEQLYYGGPKLSKQNIIVLSNPILKPEIHTITLDNSRPKEDGRPVNRQF